MSKDHDIGYLKRVDVEGGKSQLVDGFGNVAAIVDTATIARHSDNLEVRRFRIRKTPLK